MTDGPAPAEVDVTDWSLDQLNELGAAVYEHVEGVEIADPRYLDPVCPQHAVSTLTDADLIYARGD